LSRFFIIGGGCFFDMAFEMPGAKNELQKAALHNIQQSANDILWRPEGLCDDFKTVHEPFR